MRLAVPGEAAVTEPLILDRYLPAYDHQIIVARVFRAPPEHVYDVIAHLDLFRTPVAHLLLAARGVPTRLAEAAARRRGEQVVPEPPTFRIRDLPERGWTLLGEEPGRQLVYGFVGRPWTGTGGPPERAVPAEDFAGFAEPGFAKLAESTWVTAYGAGTVLTMESRVLMTDDDSRRRFQRYWIAAGPFIRLMRPTVMRALARELHRPGGRGRSGVVADG